MLPTSVLLAPLLRSADTFVLIQNGIGIHSDLHAVRPDAEVISSCAWIDSTTVDGGTRVRQTGPVARLSTLPFGFAEVPSVGTRTDLRRAYTRHWELLPSEGGLSPCNFCTRCSKRVARGV